MEYNGFSRFSHLNFFPSLAIGPTIHPSTYIFSVFFGVYLFASVFRFAQFGFTDERLNCEEIECVFSALALLFDGIV